MKTRLIEVTNGPNNWGKFLVGQFTDEASHRSAVDEDRPLLRSIGFGETEPWVMVLDLQTREGGLFYCRGNAHADLNKHRVWVCPMFEPFLEWLFLRWRTAADAGDRWWWEGLPSHVDLPDAPFAMQGYRRAGPRED